MKLEDVIKLLDRLVAAFPNQSISGKTIALYADRLSRFSEHQIRVAVAQSIDNELKFPSIAAVCERAGLAPRDLGNLDELPVHIDRALTPGRKHRFREYMDSSLAGQELDEAELVGPTGERSFPNAVFWRAHEAQLALTRERFPFHNPPSERNSFGKLLRSRL
jgi:hypothetical protein